MMNDSPALNIFPLWKMSPHVERGVGCENSGDFFRSQITAPISSLLYVTIRAQMQNDKLDVFGNQKEQLLTSHVHYTERCIYYIIQIRWLVLIPQLRTWQEILRIANKTIITEF